MHLRQSQMQRLQQRADPQLLLTNRLLQMSALELQQCVVQELSENPALESAEETGCGHCDLPGLQCPDCPMNPARRVSDRLELRGAAREEEIDPLARVASPPTLQEHLRVQLRASAGAAEFRVGEYLIAAINDDGYLGCGLDEAAAMLDVPVEVVERVLGLVQGFDPTGVGARTLQECLLIQARALSAEGCPGILEPILDRYWKELTASRWEDLARRLRVELAEVERAAVWLRAHLSPYPGRGFRPSWQKDAAGAPPRVRPDAAVRLTEEGELELEVFHEELPGLFVNPEYARLGQRMRQEPSCFDAAQRRHVQDFLQRAQMFLKSIQDRKGILRQVGECLLSEQERYLRSEQEEDMLPLTQSQLATFLRVHESTVSRAVADKFLQLPSGRVVPLSHFFDRALSQRKLVANVVASEDPAAPYSDQEISDILRREGVRIARRTVLKYREEMNILSSRRRARAASVTG